MNKIKNLQTERLTIGEAEVFASHKEAQEAGFGLYFTSYQNSMGRTLSIVTKHDTAESQEWPFSVSQWGVVVD